MGASTAMSLGRRLMPESGIAPPFDEALTSPVERIS